MAKLNGLYKSLEKALGGADEGIMQTVLGRMQPGARSINDLTGDSIKRMNADFAEFSGKKVTSSQAADRFLKSTHASAVDDAYAAATQEARSRVFTSPANATKLDANQLVADFKQRKAARASRKQDLDATFRSDEMSKIANREYDVDRARDMAMREDSVRDAVRTHDREASAAYDSLKAMGGRSSESELRAAADEMTMRNAGNDVRRTRAAEEQEARRGLDEAREELAASRMPDMSNLPSEPTMGPLGGARPVVSGNPAETVTGATGGRTVQEVAASRSGRGLEGYIRKQQGSKYDYDKIMGQHTDPAKAYEQMGKVAGQDLTGATEQQARAALAAGLNQRVASPNMMDKMGYHKVPQAAAGVGATAFLVSKMSESKGQMSNAQLYGQSSPYGM